MFFGGDRRLLLLLLASQGHYLQDLVVNLLLLLVEVLAVEFHLVKDRFGDRGALASFILLVFTR